MPSNVVSVNGVAEFVVGDSKMTSLMKWMKKYSSPKNKEARKMLKNSLK